MGLGGTSKGENPSPRNHAWEPGIKIAADPRTVSRKGAVRGGGNRGGLGQQAEEEIFLGGSGKNKLENKT